MTYDDFKKEWRSDSKEVECHTSGSTGTPSRILLPKKEMRAGALRTNHFFNISASSHLHSCISPDYIGGKMMYVRSDISGASFSFETPSNRPLSDYKGSFINLVSVVPSQMIHILNHPEILENVGHFLIGGSAIPPETRKRISDLGVSAFESYGMTETASHIALRKATDSEVYFTTLPGISVFYHNENLLGIRIENWKEFLTNDIAEIHSDNSFKILGRADNIIISGGKKISPELIESILGTNLNFPFFISSRPDEKWGKRLVLVACKDSPKDYEIFDICRASLPSWMVPKEIIRVDKMPLTANGKIKRIKF